MKINGRVAVSADLGNIVEDIRIVSAVDMEVVDAVLVKLRDQGLERRVFAGIYRCRDLHWGS